MVEYKIKKSWLSWLPALVFLALTFRFGIFEATHNIRISKVNIKIVFFSSSVVKFNAPFEHTPICSHGKLRLKTLEAYGGGYEITGFPSIGSYKIKCYTATKRATFDVNLREAGSDSSRLFGLSLIPLDQRI